MKKALRKEIDVGEFYMNSSVLNEYSNMVTLKLIEKTFSLLLIAPKLNDERVN